MSIISEITANSCAPTSLSARVQAPISLTLETTVTSADFFYYLDSKANGQADDGGTWTLAETGTTDNDPIGQWTASWDSSNLPKGQYLIGLEATDGLSQTFSYLTQAEVDALAGNPNDNSWMANPSPIPGVVFDTFINSCGVSPQIEKTVSPATVSAGQVVTYTITITNATDDPFDLTAITDSLPAGFSYQNTLGTSSPAPTTSPTNGATGDVVWTYGPDSLASGGTATLRFTAQAPITANTYVNRATMNTSVGEFDSNPAQVGVGAARLTLNKSASTSSAAEGDLITYTLSYANDSPINVTGVTLSDVLPNGLDFVAVLDGGSHNAGTLSWNIGDVSSGEGPFTVRYVAQVTNPYPNDAAVPLVNTATIDGNEVSPSSAKSSVYIAVPRPALLIQKDAQDTQILPGATTVFTISYINAGNVAATSAVITDIIPAGLEYVSASPTPATNPGVGNAGTVTWNAGTVNPGDTGEVYLTVSAPDPYPPSVANPPVNLALMDSAQTTPVSDTFDLGVTQEGLVCTTYYFRCRSRPPPSPTRAG